MPRRYPANPRSFIFFILCTLYFFTYHPTPTFLDGRILMIMCANLVNYGTLSLEKDAPAAPTANSKDKIKSEQLPAKPRGTTLRKRRQSFMTYIGWDGRKYAHYGPMQAIIAAGLYATAKAVFNTKDEPSFNLHHWKGSLAQSASMLLNPLLTILLCMLLYEILMRYQLSSSRAVILCLILGSSTPFLWLTSTFFSHTLTSLTALAALYSFIRYRRQPRIINLMVTVICLTVGLLVRVTILPYLCLLTFWGVEHIIMKRESIRRQSSLRPVFHFLIWSGMITLGLMSHFAYNYWITHQWVFSMYNQSGVQLWSHSLAHNLWGYLVSPGRSLFIYSPIVLLFFLSLPVVFQSEPRLTLFVGLNVVVYLMIYSSFWVWFGGDCYGPRYMAFLLPLCLIPVGVWLSRVSTRTFLMLTLPLGIMGFIVQLAGTLTPFAYRPKGVTLEDYLFTLEHSQLARAFHNLLNGRVLQWWHLSSSSLSEQAVRLSILLSFLILAMISMFGLKRGPFSQAN